MSTKTKTKPKKETTQIQVVQPVEVQQPVEMPGYAKHCKPCDVELVENTLNRFMKADEPSKKGIHLALLAFLATQVTTEPVSLPMVFSMLNKKLGITVNAKAGDRFRTILYNDYYAQTRSPKEYEVKGVMVKKYQWDNHIYCIVPLVMEPEHQPKKLWGFRFKPEFVEVAAKIKFDKKKLVEHSEKL